MASGTAIDWVSRRWIALVYLALAGALIVDVTRFYDVRTGFTSLLLFGDQFEADRLARLHDVPLYTYPHSAGYDGQFYAQIAVAGDPFDPELSRALDSPGYRTSRILLPVLAHLAGFGRPGWVLTAYALSNLVCWLILGWCTARWWFPPTSVDNLIRWTGVMFGAGMLVSVTRSLTDGVALLFIAAGARCLEVHRRWLAAGMLGAAGLVREMSVMAAAAVLPWTRPREAWTRDVLAAAACILPAGVWFIVVSIHYGAMSRGGLGAIGMPLVPLLHECARLVSTLVQTHHFARHEAFVVVTVLVQVGFVLGRPQPRQVWWRIGAPLAVLALFLGGKGWEDPVSAIPRTLLPLTLAFNVLVPRTPRALVLLVAGNLTVFSATTVLDSAPISEQTTFADGIHCEYVSGWYAMEQLGRRTWRWAAGSAALRFHNPLPSSRRAQVDLDLLTQTPRTVTLHIADARQTVSLQPLHPVRVHFGPFELPPGDTSLVFETTETPWVEPGAHGRPLSFRVQNLRLTVVASAEP